MIRSVIVSPSLNVPAFEIKGILTNDSPFLFLKESLYSSSPADGVKRIGDVVVVCSPLYRISQFANNASACSPKYSERNLPLATFFPSTDATLYFIFEILRV